LIVDAVKPRQVSDFTRLLEIPKRFIGWGGRIRTCAWRHQKPLPYRLATPQQGPDLAGAKAYNASVVKWNPANPLAVGIGQSSAYPPLQLRMKPGLTRARQ
jgi:hypothetical protein